METIRILNDRLLYCRILTYSKYNRYSKSETKQIISSYYYKAILKVLPLRFHKLIKELLNFDDMDNYIIAASILVKYDITSYGK